MTGEDTQTDHLKYKGGAFFQQLISRGRPTTILIFVFGVLFVVLLISWLRRGEAITKLEDENRTLNGKLGLAEFEKRGLRETIGPIVGRAYTELPEEATTRAMKKIATRWASKDAMTRPITSVLAAVEILVMSGQNVDKYEENDKGHLSLCRGSDTLLGISSDSFCARRSKDGNVEYSGVFHMSSQDSVAGTPLDLLRKTEYLTIEFDPRPGDHQVTSGKLTIIFNTSEKFEFQIPAQKVQESKVFVHGIHNLAESQIKWKNQVSISSSSSRIISQTATLEEIAKIIGSYLQYASSAEVRGPLSIEQVEEESLRSIMESVVIEGTRRDIPMVPLGFMNDRWQLFKAQLLGIDQIYYFISDKDSWSVLCGSAGYVIIREGKVVDTYTTSGN